MRQKRRRKEEDRNKKRENEKKYERDIGKERRKRTIKAQKWEQKQPQKENYSDKWK